LLNDGPELFGHGLLVSGQGIPNHGNFLGLGIKKPPAKVVHLLGIAG